MVSPISLLHWPCVDAPGNKRQFYAYVELQDRVAGYTNKDTTVYGIHCICASKYYDSSDRAPASPTLPSKQAPPLPYHPGHNLIVSWTWGTVQTLQLQSAFGLLSW